jgi:hypothetical protein
MSIRKNLLKIAIFITAIAFMTCTTPVDPGWLPDDDTYLLFAHYMTGYFNSEEQSDSNPSYWNVHLHEKRIWKDREDGIWMYVEQAIDGSEDAPYRQRVYRLEKVSATEYNSNVYMFNSTSDEDNAINAYTYKEPLESLTPDDFTHHEGCTVYLEVQTIDNETAFVGGTEGKDCTGTYQGEPSYTTSEVTITSEGLESWDRIYSQDTDTQIGGATAGPYEFLKQTNYNSELEPGD